MQSIYWYIWVAAFTIMLASLIGKVFTWKLLGDWLMLRLRFLVALAAGVFTVIIYNLGTEVLDGGFSYTVLSAFLVGGLLLEVLTRLIPHDAHHHHGLHPEHHHSPIDARRMMISDAVHNVHDGLTLVPAFLVSPVVGFGTAAGILLHELVQETSEFFVLREAGWSVRKALVWNFVVSGTILIGVTLAALLLYVLQIGHLLVAFSAGGFSYILLRDLLPSVIRHARREHRILAYALAFLLGLAVMLTISIVTPRGHPHEDEYPLPDGFILA